MAKFAEAPLLLQAYRTAAGFFDKGDHLGFSLNSPPCHRRSKAERTKVVDGELIVAGRDPTKVLSRQNMRSIRLRSR